MDKTFEKDGWTFEVHDRNLDLFTLTSETIAECTEFRVYLSRIANSPGLTRHVYFVDQLDRNAWITRGQYKTKQDALKVYYDLSETTETKGTENE